MFEATTSLLEAELIGAEPDSEMVARLDGLDRSQLSDQELVALLQARTRVISRLQAEWLADMDAVANRQPRTNPEAWDDPSSEIRAALTMTRRAAEIWMDLASELIEDYPAVWRALWEGKIDLAKARVIVYSLTGVDPQLATRIASMALERAPRQTTGQIGARIRRLVLEADPDGALKRREAELAGRRILLDANPGGSANLSGLDLPAERATAAAERINRMARRARRHDDPRTLDQIKADLFLDLLEGRIVEGSADSPAPSRGHVEVRVDWRTLAGLEDRTADLAGWGPVLGDIARRIAEDTSTRLTYTVTDGLDIVWEGTVRRRPPIGLARRVRARWQRCVFPGCRMPAAQSDLDHTQPYSEGGATTEDNLAPLCRHDHRLKHEGGWTLERLPDGRYLWNSPLGRRYEVDPGDDP